MEDKTQITALSNLTADQIDQTAELLVDSFYPMFKGISKDRNVLHKLFLPCMQRDLFYVAPVEGHIAGIIAISDCRKRALPIDVSACISIFGKAKGNIMAWQLNQILGKPAVTDPKSGYIDFLATAPEYRRLGIAGSMLTFVESNTDFQEWYLDVLAANTVAIHLYKKVGYQTDRIKKNIWMRLAGIEAMYIMKKSL